MDNTRVINSVITVILIIVAYILVVKPFIGTHWDVEYKKALNDAVNGCAKVATITYSEGSGGATHTEPVNDWYERCMKDKGY